MGNLNNFDMKLIIRISANLLLCLVIVFNSGCKKDPPKVIPTLTTTVSVILSSSATVTGNISDNGGAAITGKGVCWGTTPEPTVNNQNIVAGLGNGEFSITINGLNPGGKYYIRSYATNSIGTGYGNQVIITTPAVLASVTTTAISEISATSALTGGNIQEDGGAAITARGVCWDVNQNPTILNNKTIDGTGSGTFTSSINGLNSKTTYYVRAYATSSAGTTYGNQITFTTALALPVLTTSDVTSITSVMAATGGTITSEGGSAVILRGICWSTSPDPTVSNSKTTNGFGTGNFTCNITGLTPGTKYYIRAYATNSAGTAYGNELSFMTLTDNVIEIPDANFKKFCLQNFDQNRDGVIRESEVFYVLNLFCQASNISSLSGLEYFKNIEQLNCGNNNISHLDVSKNIKLKNITCWVNKLTSLDVSKNTELEELYCMNNKLTELNVGNNKKLRRLNINDNSISSLDLSQNNSLFALMALNNKLSQINLSNCLQLTEFWCNNNNLTTLDVSANTNLTSFICSQNQLTQINIGNNTNLIDFFCSNNQISSFDLSKITKVEKLDCSYNLINNIDISKNTSLKQFSCVGNKISSFDFSNNSELTDITVHENLITNLDVSHNRKLISLGCWENLLSSLDLSQNTELKYLLCDANRFSTIDVSKNRKLEWFNAQANFITSLDLSQNPELVDVRLNRNNISSINLKSNKKLEILQLFENRISSIDLTENTALKLFYCQFNQLTSIDLSKNRNIEKLSCNGNPSLTEIFLSPGQNIANIVKDHFTTIKFKSASGAPLKSR